MAREFNKVSAEDIQYRRKHGLCYRCGEKFGAGHRCRTGNLNCLDLEEGEETDFEDAEGEQEENTGIAGELATISLNALNNARSGKSIILCCNMGELTIINLLVNRASNRFIRYRLTKAS